MYVNIVFARQIKLFIQAYLVLFPVSVESYNLHISEDIIYCKIFNVASETVDAFTLQHLEELFFYNIDL